MMQGAATDGRREATPPPGRIILRARAQPVPASSRCNWGAKSRRWLLSGFAGCSRAGHRPKGCCIMSVLFGLLALSVCGQSAPPYQIVDLVPNPPTNQTVNAVKVNNRNEVLINTYP